MFCRNEEHVRPSKAYEKIYILCFFLHNVHKQLDIMFLDNMKKYRIDPIKRELVFFVI